MPAVAAPIESESARFDFGAFVVSLDIELMWGLRDRCEPGDAERTLRRVLGGRAVMPRILDLFDEYGIAATWAVVGFLFARSRQELVSFYPAVLPVYADRRLSPYAEEVGASEAEDPLHFAPSLVAAIQERPNQEIATHTFSHYYCLEPGQSRDAFEADLRSAVAIAAEHGVTFRTIVFPRNQVNRDYTDVLRDVGIRCYRGTPSAWMYQTSDFATSRRALRRMFRLADNYLPLSGPNTARWSDVRRENGLFNVPASFYLRPYSPRLRHLEPVRFRRIAQAIRMAAAAKGIVHLWWHAWDFAAFPDENLALLRRMLEIVAECRELYGMRSLSMAMVADLASGSGSQRERCGRWGDGDAAS